MSNLPYNVDAGNGITDVDELYAYMTKCPLCVFDRNFMESYGRILCRNPGETHEYFTKAAHSVRLSEEAKEMGFTISADDVEERAHDFNIYLQRFSEYDCEGCTEDADGNVIIHVLNASGYWEQNYKR